MIEAGGKNLVFLLSTPRAGSTLVSAILTRHSQMHCPNEPWFLLGLAALYHGGNITYAPYEHHGVEAGLRDLLSEDQFLEAARAFAAAAYGRKLAESGKRVFVDKTPRYYHILPFLERLFPEARKVWLKRNPLDVVASYQTSWQLTVDQIFDPAHGPMCYDIPLGLSRLADFFRGQPHTFEFRYEDFAQRPAAVLESLCAFLGLVYEPGMENYGSDPEPLEDRKRRCMGDPNVFAHAGPHTQSINRWETVLAAPQIQKTLDCIGARFFERMGYGETVEQLRTKGFRFPDEAAVEANLKQFEESARSLPWARVDAARLKELEALCGSLTPERDRLLAECQRLTLLLEHAAEKERSGACGGPRILRPLSRVWRRWTRG